MNPVPQRRPFLAPRQAATAGLLALAGLLACGGAAAAGPGDTWSLTLTYSVEPASPSVGNFVLGAAVSGQPGVFSVSDFSVVIGPPGYAYDYNLPDAGLRFDTATGLFGGGTASHAYTSDGDQLDFVGSAQWKTDDFFDPHPICDVAYCGGFHYGTYAAVESTPAVPEPGSLGLMLAGAAVMVAWARRRQAS